jgi:mannose-1-phosphate guanylyltransferase/phosphomannomutase
MEDFFRDDTFIVIGCDILTDANLHDLVAFHRMHGAIATIALTHMERVEQYGVVITDPNGLIVDFQEKPAPGTERAKDVNTGIYCFDPEIFKHIAPNVFIDFGKNVFPALQKARAPFYGMPVPNAYWCDIGTPEEYRRGTDDVLSGRLGTLAGRVGIPAGTAIGKSVQIDENVHIGAGVTIGDRVRVVGPSVIGDRARIAADAFIERSILWDDVVVGEGAHLDYAIIGNSYQIARGAKVNGVIIANGERVAG